MVANLYNQEDFNVFKELKKKKRKPWRSRERGREEGKERENKELFGIHCNLKKEREKLKYIKSSGGFTFAVELI